MGVFISNEGTKIISFLSLENPTIASMRRVVTIGKIIHLQTKPNKMQAINHSKERNLQCHI
jgi:hypothetical protein